MKVKIILNPYANRWGARGRASEIEDACRQVGVDFDLTEMQGASQGKQEAMDAVDEGYDAVVAAGGDGTVNEVVNGLITVAGDDATKPLGIFPVGTGNDFNDMSGLSRNLLSAAKTIANGKTQQLDAGQVTFDGITHYFDNNCALAMEPMVTIENIHIKRLSGNIRYVVALFKALAKLSAWHMRLTWDTGSFEGPTILLSVCNSPRTGGIFPMAPDAIMDDGLFDFVFVPEISKMAVISLLPRLIRGTHIHNPQVSYERTRELTVESQPGTPIHADGEVISESATHLRYDILPGKITLLTP